MLCLLGPRWPAPLDGGSRLGARGVGTGRGVGRVAGPLGSRVLGATVPAAARAARGGEFVNNRLASGGLAGRRRPYRGWRLAGARSVRARANWGRGHRRQRRGEAAEPAAAGAVREGRSGRGRMFPAAAAGAVRDRSTARGTLGGPADRGSGHAASCGLCAAPRPLSAGPWLCLVRRLRGDGLGAPGRRRVRARRRGARARTRRSAGKGRT